MSAFTGQRADSALKNPSGMHVTANGRGGTGVIRRVSVPSREKSSFFVSPRVIPVKINVPGSQAGCFTKFTGLQV